MKTLALSLIFLCSSINLVSAQKLDSFKYGEKEIVVGDTFQLTKGSLNGRYVNIFISQPKRTSIGSQFDGRIVIVKEIKKEKIDKKPVVVAILRGMEPFKVKCLLREVLETKELVPYKRN